MFPLYYHSASLPINEGVCGWKSIFDRLSPSVAVFESLFMYTRTLFYCNKSLRSFDAQATESLQVS